MKGRLRQTVPFWDAPTQNIEDAGEVSAQDLAA